MSEYPIVEILGVLGTILGSMWAMFERFNKSVSKNQQAFLDYIEKKNGHMERISKQFSDTVKDFNGTIATLTEKIDSIDRRV